MKGVSFLICLLEFLSCYATIAPDDEKWPVKCSLFTECHYGPDELFSTLETFEHKAWWYDDRLVLTKTFQWDRAVFLEVGSRVSSHKAMNHFFHFGDAFKHLDSNKRLQIPDEYCGIHLNFRFEDLELIGDCRCITPACYAIFQPYFYMYLNIQDGVHRLWVDGYSHWIRGSPCSWNCICPGNRTLDKYYLFTGAKDLTTKRLELQLTKFLTCYLKISFSYAWGIHTPAVYDITLPCKSECVMFTNGQRTVDNCRYARGKTWDLIIVSPFWNATLQQACQNASKGGGSCVFMHGDYLGVQLTGKSCFGYSKSTRGSALDTCAKMKLVPLDVTIQEGQNVTFHSSFKWIVGPAQQILTTAMGGEIHVNKYWSSDYNYGWQDPKFKDRTFTNDTEVRQDKQVGLRIVKLLPNDSLTYDFQVIQPTWVSSGRGYRQNPWQDFKYYPRPIALKVLPFYQRCDIFLTSTFAQLNTTCIEGSANVIAFDPHYNITMRNMLWAYTNHTGKTSIFIYDYIRHFNFTSQICIDVNNTDYCRRIRTNTASHIYPHNSSIVYNRSQTVFFNSSHFWSALVNSASRAWLMISNYTTFSSWALDITAFHPSGQHTVYTENNFTYRNITAKPEQGKKFVYAYNLTKQAAHRCFKIPVNNTFLYLANSSKNSTV
ncbi:protein TE12 [Testudinid alphaherpesvirus 3]|uniref:Protein TE12 n=2 Tax=Testudinid alphaherpesvirus 3 TaxID=2560801 RepID=A0A0M3LCR2_9ALPH|nr:protein TE12 [Testudinid alphaherpesvirus 3]AIU39323.1 protein TE12 [Testudinid alphaherpesvirus 3]